MHNLRAKGLSYREIGKALGISSSAARYLVNSEEHARAKVASAKWRRTGIGRVKAGLAYTARLAKLKGYAAVNATAEEVLAAKVPDCPICLTKDADMVIDHNHITGEFRGWICRTCNGAIGMLGDDVETLRRAIAHIS